MAKSYSSSAILKHWKAGSECACPAVFETCPGQGKRSSGNEIGSAGQGILVPIALFSSLSRRGLGTRIDSRAKAPPAKR